MRASSISYAFLGSFLLTIFLLRQSPAPYPLLGWIFMIFLSGSSAIGTFFSRTRINAALTLAVSLGLMIGCLAMTRITVNPTPSLIGDNNPAMSLLTGARVTVERQVTRLYPEPHAALLIGLLTGTRSALPKPILDDFRDTGLTHLLAISGYNITLLLTILSSFLFWLPLRWRFVPLSLGVIAFTLFTGASASVVRAAVMGIIGLLALQTGRIQTTRLTIGWAAFCMLAWNPTYLWDDAGFQLSFLAVIGLSEMSPLLEPWCKRLPDTFGLRTAFQTTMAVQLTATPWILFAFGRLSLIAPLSNLLAPPLVPIAMLIGAVSIALHAVFPPLGMLLAVPAYLALTVLLLIGQLLARVPYASLDMGMSVWMLYGCYGLLILWRSHGASPTTHTATLASASSPTASRSLPLAAAAETQTHARGRSSPAAIPDQTSPRASPSAAASCTETPHPHAAHPPSAHPCARAECHHASRRSAAIHTTTLSAPIRTPRP